MFRKPSFAVIVVSAILLIYCILINFDSTLPIGIFLLSISPFLLIWMAYAIIRFGRYTGRDLNEEEWGYADMDKENLGEL